MPSPRLATCARPELSHMLRTVTSSEQRRFERRMEPERPLLNRNCNEEATEPQRAYGCLDDPYVSQTHSQTPSIRRAEPPPDVMVFYTWWTENAAVPAELCRSGDGHGPRRQVEVRFDTSESLYQIIEGKQTKLMRIERPDGTPMRPTELFVGAKIQIYGKLRTLMKANAKTTAWLDMEARRQIRRRDALSIELAKYVDVPKAMANLGFAQLYLIAREPSRVAAAPTGGTANLARLGEEVHAMEQLLSRHRAA
mmetsp:Transcript_17123/g.28675  ORF Transcript_17123/g.28675 Transcript_17123/m.28675 type:complete len:253 (-) Transcript_17123:392-1150(-)